jgi:hypothetical protein
MSSIGGPGGIGGPKGPTGPDGADEVGDVAEAPAAGETTSLDATLAQLRSGQLTPREAIDRMVDDAGVGLGQTERAELRELIVDLVANDPYLSSLVGRVS